MCDQRAKNRAQRIRYLSTRAEINSAGGQKTIHARCLAGPLERRAGIWGRTRAFWNCRADTAAAKSRRIRYAFLSHAPRCSSNALRSLSGKRHADSTWRWQPDHERSAEVEDLDAKRSLLGAEGCA